MSDPSIIPETTLPLSSDEVREREQERQARPVVMVRATQESPVADRLEDEVRDIREEVRRLATRFDGQEERFDRLEKSVVRGFDNINGWSGDLAERLRTKEQRTDENDRAVAVTLQTILDRLDGISGRIRPAE